MSFAINKSTNIPKALRRSNIHDAIVNYDTNTRRRAGQKQCFVQKHQRQLRRRTMSLSSASTSSSQNTPKATAKVEANSNIKVGKFQAGNYDKPIVLIGCSGGGNELNRLATSLVKALSGNEDEEGTVIYSRSSSPSKREEGTTLIIDADADIGHQAEQLQTQIQSMSVSRSDVIVIDFSTSTSTSNSEELVELTRALYEDEGLLSVYVNVHPTLGQIDENSRKTKEELENDVFIRYSNYEICIKDEGLSPADGNDNKDNENGGWSDIEWELSRLVARAILPPPAPGAPSSVKQAVVGQNAELTLGKNTFFLSIVFPDINQVRPYVEEMCKDVDAMEFRCDLLEKKDDRFEVIHSLQVLRRMCRPFVQRAPALPLVGLRVIDDAMPIVFTVRTAHQAGTYPDDEVGIRNMFKLLELGLRGGVEVLDVESGWDPVQIDNLLSLAEESYTSNILGSEHIVPNEISMEDAVKVFHQCSINGRAHGAKVVLSINDNENKKDHQAYEAGKIFHNELRANHKPVIPYLSMILGEVGRISRVINERFAPVTHETLPFVAAPGQLTPSEIMVAKIAMGRLTGKKYCIIGHNIDYSVSPQMQSAAFEATRLPHSYTLVDVETVDEFVTSDLWTNDKDFGGCSVTIPHKQTIIPHLDELSEAAEKIGAVNTVIVKHEEGGENGKEGIQRILYGENTDWRGIYTSLRRRLGGSKETDKTMVGENRKDVVLIVGSGGAARAAAYAVVELGGYEILYHNPRTPSKATDLAMSFGGKVVHNVQEDLVNTLEDMNGDIRVVISTLPADADFVLPEWVVHEKDSSEEIDASEDSNYQPSNRKNQPIVFDVNYKPYWTKLLAQADEAGLNIVRGSEMLWEQGVGQFELWTERMAPYRVMKRVVLENCPPSNKNDR